MKKKLLIIILILSHTLCVLLGYCLAAACQPHDNKNVIQPQETMIELPTETSSKKNIASVEESTEEEKQIPEITVPTESMEDHAETTKLTEPQPVATVPPVIAPPAPNPPPSSEKSDTEITPPDNASDGEL